MLSCGNKSALQKSSHIEGNKAMIRIQNFCPNEKLLECGILSMKGEVLHLWYLGYTAAIGACNLLTGEAFDH